MSDSYAAAGVDTAAGDRAVELMRAAVSRTHGPEVVGGVGGFAGLFDVSALRDYRRPLLATGTDGVGTKVAIAQALDKHDTVGQDLVGMIVDDIVVVGARPLFLTDYIACGRLVPERIAEIVRGVANACEATGTALVGGETAEHPGLMGPDDYDLAGAAVGVVEADALLGPDRVRDGDSILALASSGLHSNGFSLVRKILADAGLGYRDRLDDLGGPVGLTLLEPTRLYTSALLAVLADPIAGGAVHAFSHVTGGGIAANLARVLPKGSWAEVERSTWSPPAVFQVLSELSGSRPEDHEPTWNLGIGMFAIVDGEYAGEVAATIAAHGIECWLAGTVRSGARDFAGFEQGAKGVDGGAVRLSGSYRS
jgi:phosphoribosylformylglycinamidine cyclo-ligase